jgi:hypothetical protein
LRCQGLIWAQRFGAFIQNLHVGIVAKQALSPFAGDLAQEKARNDVLFVVITGPAAAAGGATVIVISAAEGLA